MKKVYLLAIDELLRDEVKVYSAKNKLSMNDFIIEAIKEKLK